MYLRPINKYIIHINLRQRRSQISITEVGGFFGVITKLIRKKNQINMQIMHVYKESS